MEKEKGQYWNHRVVKRQAKTTDDVWYEIHEVYYENDEVEGMTENAISPAGTTLSELKEEIKRMLRCLEKPVLDYETRRDKISQEYKNNRVVKIKYKAGEFEETWYEIHDVEQDENGEIKEIKKDANIPIANSIKELKIKLNDMLNCLNENILEF